MRRDPTHHMDEDDTCLVCQKDPHDCTCTECDNCRSVGDRTCKVNKGPGCRGEYVGCVDGEPKYIHRISVAVEFIKKLKKEK